MIMRALTLIALLASPTAALAQEEEAEGPGLLEGTIGLLMENMLREVQPGMEQMGDSMGSTLMRLRPVLQDLSVLVDDLRHYQAPERLENGDIVIRRKPGAPPAPPIGDNLRDLTTPRPDATPEMPDFSPDPNQPEVEL